MYGAYPYSDVPYTNTPGGLTSLPPTVSLNTPADAATIADTTPTLVFTGTDVNADEIEYNVQIATAGTYTGTMASNTIYNSNTPIYGGNASSGQNSQAKGQTFTADGRLISRISFSLLRGGTPVDDLTLTIRDGMDGNILASVTIAMSAVIDSGWTNFDFTAPCPTVNGVEYFLQLNRSPDIYDTVNYVWLCLSSGNLFPGGLFYKHSTVWSIDYINLDADFIVYSPTILDKLSATDTGFTDITNGADTHPFASGNQIDYTVQAGEALAAGTYYWRVAGIDPLGSNTYGAWATTRSFTITGATGIKVWNGSTWGYKPVKVWNGSSWVVKPVKVWNGSSWVIKG